MEFRHREIKETKLWVSVVELQGSLKFAAKKFQTAFFDFLNMARDRAL